MYRHTGYGSAEDLFAIQISEIPPCMSSDPKSVSDGHTVPLATYQRIYAMVRQIPRGQVATYGQIAQLVGRCTARMVGYAMAGLDFASDVPWYRVINYRGRISPRPGEGAEMQHRLLQEEGVVFDAQDSIPLHRFRWSGPSISPDAAPVPDDVSTARGSGNIA